MNYEARVAKVKEKFLADGVEALLVSKGTDIRYLSGFTGEAGVALLVLTDKKNYFITDGRFTNQAKMETTGMEIILWKSGSGLYKEGGELLKELGIKRAAIDCGEFSHADYLTLTGTWGQEVEDSKPYITTLRMVKDADELELIRKACDITEQSFLALLKLVKPGQTEKEIRNLLEYEFRKRGSVDVSFATIVASGPENGGNPHASLTDRKVQQGDMITIDFGASYEGYCSDMTRTFAIGDPGEKLKEIYRVVYEAKKAAEAALHVGAIAKDIDKAARDVIVNAGYELPHGPGHGFGLDIHEDPFLGFRNTYAMEENVVHTIEPGIYVPGTGGIRIEDDYLIKGSGAECLTPNITNELIIL